LTREKIPNVERCEIFQSEEPVKPLNSKSQWKMHMNFILDEVGLVGKLATSLRTSHRETPRRKKYGDAKYAKD
jgi:hypothetical protein